MYAKQSSSSANRPVRDPRRLNVLVADRNAHFRETIRRVLARLEGCVVTGEAATISEVIRLGTTAPLDLVLLDVEMVTPDRLAELKRVAAQLPELKVVVLLSVDMPAYREAVLEHGGHFSVAKATLEDELPSVLEQVLAGTLPHAS